jgi:hypothetical protein
MRHHALLVLLCATIAACGGNTDASGSNGSGVTQSDAGADASQPDAGDLHAAALSYAREDIACTKDSDCCVVIDLCKNQGLVVGAEDRATVTELISDWNAIQTATGSRECNMCIPPPIEVSCGAAGFCVGAEASCAWDPALSSNHCGKAALSDSGCATATPLSTEPAAPGKRLQTVLGCGT